MGKRMKLPEELSGGQQQRAAIARALANRPAVLLADEPTGNLDSATAADVIGLLKASSRKYSQTVLMVTHNEVIAQSCDRIFRIEDGRLCPEGDAPVKPYAPSSGRNMSYYKRDTAACLCRRYFCGRPAFRDRLPLYSSRMGNLENNRLIYGDWNYYTLKTGPLMQELREGGRHPDYDIVSLWLRGNEKVLTQPGRITLLYGDENYRSMLHRELLEGVYPKTEARWQWIAIPCVILGLQAAQAHRWSWTAEPIPSRGL